MGKKLILNWTSDEESASHTVCKLAATLETWESVYKDQQLESGVCQVAGPKGESSCRAQGWVKASPGSYRKAKEREGRIGEAAAIIWSLG